MRNCVETRILRSILDNTMVPDVQAAYVANTPAAMVLPLLGR